MFRANEYFLRLILAFGFGIVIFSTRPARAEPFLVISDIDDTIQLTRIHFGWNIFDFGLNLVRSHDSFIGMSNLYNFLQSRGAEFHYVTGAPEIISYLPQKFLVSTGFHGKLWLRPSFKIPTEEFKVQKIKEILRSRPHQKVILLGDDGEYDVRVYDRIQQDPEFKDRIHFVFIHDLYGSKDGMTLAENQIPYVTAVEIALELYFARILSDYELTQILEIVLNGFESPSPSVRNRTLPRFADIHEGVIKNLYDQSAKLHLDIHQDLLTKIMHSVGRRFSLRSPLREVCAHIMRKIHLGLKPRSKSSR